MTKRLPLLIRKVKLMGEAQRQLLMELLEGQRFLCFSHGTSYAVKRVGEVWSVVNLADNTEYTVGSEMQHCTCPDSKYRTHACKHCLMLRSLL